MTAVPAGSAVFAGWVVRSMAPSVAAGCSSRSWSVEAAETGEEGAGPKSVHQLAQLSLVVTCFLPCMETERRRRVEVGTVEAVQAALRLAAEQFAESVVGLHKLPSAAGRSIWSPCEALVTVDLGLAPAPGAARLAIRADDPEACPH